MTAIAGLVDNGTVYLMGDSAGVSASTLHVTVRSDVKVFRVHNFVMGFTSSFRMGELLQFKLNPPLQTVGHTSDYHYICTDFVDSVRKLFVDNGFGNASQGGNFLLGYNGVLYNIQGDYQVGIASPTTPFGAKTVNGVTATSTFDSVGCGMDLCLGSLYSTQGQDPETRLRMALEAAAQFSGGVRGPFNMVKLESNVVKPVVAQTAKTKKPAKSKK